MLCDNMKALSDTELQKCLVAIHDEIERRRKFHKEHLWNEVRKAIANYIEEFDYIEVENDDSIVYINKFSKTDNIGEVNCQ